MGISNNVKEQLFSIIQEMASAPHYFCVSPEKDFTRNRQLTFEKTIKFILTMGGGSLNSEILKYFEYDLCAPTASALVQSRYKILPLAFKFLLHEFNSRLTELKYFRKYRLLAVDGSDVNIPHNPNDKTTYFQSVPDTKGFNQIHVNVMYDLVNKLYLDAVIQPGRQENEKKAFVEMIDRLKIEEPTLVVADRGYENYNAIAHMEKRRWKYLIRVKDVGSNGMLSGYITPQTDEFDIDISRLFTRRNTNQIKTNPEVYKFLPQNQNFDYLPPKSKETFKMSFRIVRLEVEHKKYQAFITNLDREAFPMGLIKEIYHMRWGVETAFRELKYNLGTVAIKSKSMHGIEQEIFSKIIVYNVCEAIILKVTRTNSNTRYVYQVNTTRAMQICLQFIRQKSNAPPIDVEALIGKYILPIRKNRKFDRKIKHKRFQGFNYSIT